MMKIKYVGTPTENLHAIDMYGIHFPINKSVEVTDKFAIRKLSNHPHFRAAEVIEDATPYVLPQTIPSVENGLVVTLGHAVVTEYELQTVRSDPFVSESGVPVTYSELLDAKGPNHGEHAGTSTESVKKVGRPRKQPDA